MARCGSASGRIVSALERAFYLLGAAVCRRPWTTVVLCAALTVAAGVSLAATGLRRESSPFRLWVPPESRFASDTRWLAARFGLVVRAQHVLAVAPNALEPAVLARLANLTRLVEERYGDVCLKVPTLPKFARGANLPSAVPDVIFCAAVKALRLDCLRGSPLELWDYDAERIARLEAGEAAEAIETVRTGPVSGHPVDFVRTLGGVVRDDRGRIVSAGSVLLSWFVRVNFSAVEEGSVGNSAGTEEWTSPAALEWERRFLKTLERESADASGPAVVRYEAERSFGDTSGGEQFRDAGKLAVGIVLMFVYIQLILSGRDWVEARPTLGSVGLLCIGMALVVACAVCSALGAPYGPVHDSLPFLLMGLGIDDMFVMKACWESLTEAEAKLPLPERVGLMLQHAGVSIVITSFTDIVAFLVGSITILPSLRSFCLYAATGVLFIFIFSITFYVAIFVLDTQRMMEKRNAFLFCIKHPDHVPSSPAKKSLSHRILNRFYSAFIFKTPAQISILAFTVIVTGFSAAAVFRLEQRFDPNWFVPENSYYSDYLKARKMYYPNMGNEGSIFMGALNYSEELPKIYETIDKLSNQTDIFENLNSWTTPFRSYLRKRGVDPDNITMSDLEWRTHLSKFLHSPAGGRFQLNFRFKGELKCGAPTPPITVSSVDFTFKIFDGPGQYLPAKHRIENIVDSANFTTGDRFATVWAKVFANWVTDEVIHIEVERNLELALICVMVCTLILIADLQMCFWIFICVLLTLINVCGFMQRWGLTIDIVSCVGLELGIGFCVDYAAHIGHTFLTVQGSRKERALSTVTSMGAAVLYGGGSTLLSLSVLSFSETYVFKTFFKIFFLVIAFGLFNGLLFLPVVLSLIGPQPNDHNHKQVPVDDIDNECKDVQLEVVNSTLNS